jgi:hypothetical protein
MRKEYKPSSAFKCAYVCTSQQMHLRKVKSEKGVKRERQKEKKKKSLETGLFAVCTPSDSTPRS